MSRAALRRGVIDAQNHLLVERTAWQRRTLALRARIARHREALIVAGGFAAGIFSGLLPFRGVANATRTVVGTATFFLRHPLGNLLMQGLRRDDDDATPSRPEAPSE